MLRTVLTAHESWPLSVPFRISRGVRTAAEVITLEVREEGFTGRGEAVPYPRYGESAESVLEQLASVRMAVETAEKVSPAELLPPGAALNALDCALWDLRAAKARTNVCALLGNAPVARMKTAQTISLDTPEAMHRVARSFASAPVLKVKVDASRPLEQLSAVRSGAPDAELIVDANEGWSLSLLVELQPMLRSLGTVFVEQPLPSADDWQLAERRFDVPLCADESCHTAADLPDLRRKGYSYVNIKLDKAGGLTGALDLHAAARSHGFGIMVGCMLSTSLSLMPAIEVARDADFVDLDGAMWLEKDRPGALRLTNGVLEAAPEPCWGYHSAEDEPDPAVGRATQEIR